MSRSLAVRQALFLASCSIVLLGILGLGGCTSSMSYLTRCDPVFPPQEVMKSSHYAAFLAENEQKLKRCSNSQSCEDALFNLGFVHAYPQSPFHDTGLALSYFGRLVKDYPACPRAYEALGWMTLINRNLEQERKERVLLDQLRQKSATIEKLHKQMQRSREIDMEIGRKERQLLR